MIRFLAGAFWSDGRVPEGKWIKMAESDRRVLADSAVFFLFLYLYKNICRKKKILL